jgi:hypothetical protein
VVVTLSSSNPALAAVPASLFIAGGANSADFLVSTKVVSASTTIDLLASYDGATQGSTLTLSPPTLIPHSGWSVVYVDSQETSCGNWGGSNAIDGNNNTFWHTQFCGGTPSVPHEIQIDLGAFYTLSAFQYMPRQDGSACGWIKEYEFYVSTDGVNWGTPVAVGNFDYTGYAVKCPGPGAGVPGALQVAFPATTGQFIRLHALSEISGNPWTAAAEINVLGGLAVGSAALASVSLNPAIVVGGSPATGTVTLNGPAPAGGAVVTLSSSNTQVVTVPPSVTVLAGNSTATFTVTTSTVTSATQVSIGGSYNGNQAAALMVNSGSPVSHINWSVVYVDSQETTCAKGAGSNVIDGNTSTMWHTQFCTTTAPMPHEIQINLGASYSLTAFQYLPRQDGSACGWIKQYEFYVSPDGVTWGAPVAAGTFDYSGYPIKCPGPGAGAPPPLAIGFPAATGQFIRLRALSEINGNPWTSAAEINVLGDLQPGLLMSATGVTFPDQLVNTASAPMPIVLTNVGLSAVGITAVGTSDDFAQTNNCGASLPALSSCTISVTFTPKGSGYRSSLLTVLNSATGPLSIPLSGTGVSPVLALSRGSTVFEPQLLNTTGSAPSINVLNVGDWPLLVSNVVVTGDFRQINDCAGSIDSSLFCTIQVFFTPTALGARSGTMTIFDNTAVGSHSVSMSGVGVSTHNVTLSWTPSSSLVVGYFVYRAKQPGGPYTELNSVPQTETTFTDSVPGGATYFYIVTAVDANLVESLPSAEVPATIPAP